MVSHEAPETKEDHIDSHQLLIIDVFTVFVFTVCLFIYLFICLQYLPVQGCDGLNLVNSLL